MGAYLRLVESGELTAIIDKTLMSGSGGSETGQLRRVVLMLVGAGLVALFGMLVWSRSLRHEVQRRTVELHRAAERQKVQAHVLSQVTDAIVVADVNALVTTWNAGAESHLRPPRRRSRGTARRVAHHQSHGGRARRRSPQRVGDRQ